MNFMTYLWNCLRKKLLVLPTLQKKLVGWRDRRAKRMSFHGTHIIKQG